MGNIDAERLLPCAFAACGIYPIDAERVCEKIVEVASAPLIARHVDEVLLNRFEVTRFGDKKKKKLRVAKRSLLASPTLHNRRTGPAVRRLIWMNHRSAGGLERKKHQSSRTARRRAKPAT